MVRRQAVCAKAAIGLLLAERPLSPVAAISRSVDGWDALCRRFDGPYRPKEDRSASNASLADRSTARFHRPASGGESPSASVRQQERIRPAIRQRRGPVG